MNDESPAQIANEHWRRFYRGLVESLGGEWRRFGAVDAFSTPHLAASFANGLLVIEPADPADVVQAIDWVRPSGVPFGVRIDTTLGDELLEAPISAGLVRAEWTMPGMILAPPPEAPDPPAGVTVERVVEANFADFIQATVDCGMPRAIAENAFDLAATREGGLDFFVGRLHGRPAATATLVATDEDVSGIYAVATVEDAQRHGLGRAVTWAAVDRAREWGAQAVVLQASPMGLNVYRQIGFREVVSYALFVPPES